MKTILLSIITTLLIGFTAFGQATINETGFAFQGYARDADGAAISNQAINVQISIYQPSNAPIYVEAHTSNVQTDTYGVFAIVVGRGTPSTGTFSNINFTAANYNIKIEVRPAGGSYVTISDAQLLSVAYAKAAQVAITANNGTLPGTIISWAGATVPNGYLVCDGRALNSSSNPEYAALYAAIQNAWGGNNNSDFRIPDLRGRFIRGRADGQNDPDRGDRTALHTGGNTGDNVGSYQGDTFRQHNHSGNTSTEGQHNHINEGQLPANATEYGYVFFNGQGTATGADNVNSVGFKEMNLTTFANQEDAGSHSHTIPNDGGSETRPTNAYVVFLIKY